MKNYQEFNSAIKELLLFKDNCPYYFGLKTEAFPPPNGIPNFKELHDALAQLNDWYKLGYGIKATNWEQFKIKYDFIVGLIASDDFSTKKGNKSLHWPSQGYPYLVKSLINAGAKVNVLDIHGNNPLMFALLAKNQAADNENFQTVELFEKSQLPIIKDLLDAGTDITQKTSLNTNVPLAMALNMQGSPIVLAIQEGYSNIVKIMLEHPRNKSLVLEPKSGFIAIKHNHSKILRLLINHNKQIAHCPLITADTKITDTNVCKQSLVVMAALSNHFECVQELLKENIQIHEIKLALKLVLRPGNEKMIATLITAALKPAISGLIETEVNLIPNGDKAGLIVKFGLSSSNEFSAAEDTIMAINILNELGMGSIDTNNSTISFYLVSNEIQNTNQANLYSNDEANMHAFFNNMHVSHSDDDSMDISFTQENDTTNNLNS